MLSAEEILPFRILEENSSAESSNPTDAVIFVGISLVLGIACRHVLRGTRVPYTVALLDLGIGIGSLGYLKISVTSLYADRLCSTACLCVTKK